MVNLERNRVYNARYRAKNIARGLTAKGLPRTIPVGANRHVEAGKIGQRVWRIRYGKA